MLSKRASDSYDRFMEACEASGDPVADALLTVVAEVLNGGFEQALQNCREQMNMAREASYGPHTSHFVTIIEIALEKGEALDEYLNGMSDEEGDAEAPVIMDLDKLDDKFYAFSTQLEDEVAVALKGSNGDDKDFLKGMGIQGSEKDAKVVATRETLQRAIAEANKLLEHLRDGCEAMADGGTEGLVPSLIDEIDEVEEIKGRIEGLLDSPPEELLAGFGANSLEELLDDENPNGFATIVLDDIKRLADLRMSYAEAGFEHLMDPTAVTSSAKEEKRFRITKTKRSMHGPDKTYKQEGTLAELVSAYKYTLDTGASYAGEKGRKKINADPKTIDQLVRNLEAASANAAANGDSGISYSYEAIESAKTADFFGDSVRDTVKYLRVNKEKLKGLLTKGEPAVTQELKKLPASAAKPGALTTLVTQWLNKTISDADLTSGVEKLVQKKGSVKDATALDGFGDRDAAITDEVGKFWVVTEPTKISEMNDILFESDVLGMMWQAKGGLNKTDVVGIYKDHANAERTAQQLLVKAVTGSKKTAADVNARDIRRAIKFLEGMIAQYKEHYFNYKKVVVPANGSAQVRQTGEKIFEAIAGMQESLKLLNKQAADADAEEEASKEEVAKEKKGSVKVASAWTYVVHDLNGGKELATIEVPNPETTDGNEYDRVVLEQCRSLVPASFAGSDLKVSWAAGATLGNVYTLRADGTPERLLYLEAPITQDDEMAREGNPHINAGVGGDPNTIGGADEGSTTELPVNFFCNTSGKGYWSSTVTKVQVTNLELTTEYFSGDPISELRVYFNKMTWNTDKLGLIYTDQQWQREFKQNIQKLGLNPADVHYSEQGMQGDDYVSMDVGPAFIKSWNKKMKTASACECGGSDGECEGKCKEATMREGLPLWQYEFGPTRREDAWAITEEDIPQELRQGSWRGFEDQSWHNDVCPHWDNKEYKLAVWVDSIDASKREWPMDEFRFAVIKMDDPEMASDKDELLLASNDWNEVKVFLENQTRSWIMPPAKSGAAKTTKCVDCKKPGAVDKMKGNPEGAGYLCADCLKKRKDEDKKKSKSASRVSFKTATDAPAGFTPGEEGERAGAKDNATGVDSEFEYVKKNVSIDLETMGNYPAWCPLDESGDTVSWNGWECPSFEKAECDRIVAEMNAIEAAAGNNSNSRYDAATDTYIISSEGEEDGYKGYDINTPEGRKHVWAIGAWGWIWDSSDEGSADIGIQGSKKNAEKRVRDRGIEETLAELILEDLEARSIEAEFGDASVENAVKFVEAHWPHGYCLQQALNDGYDAIDYDFLLELIREGVRDPEFFGDAVEGVDDAPELDDSALSFSDNDKDFLKGMGIHAKQAADDAFKLSREFSRLLKEELDPEEFQELITRTQEEADPGICHSHDFCDANMVMYDAFKNVFGRDLCLEGDENPQFQADIELVNLAWDLAKQDLFGEKKDLTTRDQQEKTSAVWQNAEPTPGTTVVVYGLSFLDMDEFDRWIEDGIRTKGYSPDEDWQAELVKVVATGPEGVTIESKNFGTLTGVDPECLFDPNDDSDKTTAPLGSPDGLGENHTAAAKVEDVPIAKAGPTAEKGDHVENALDFLSSNAESIVDGNIADAMKLLEDAGYSREVVSAAITQTFGPLAETTLSQPVSESLGTQTSAAPTPGPQIVEVPVPPRSGAPTSIVININASADTAAIKKYVRNSSNVEECLDEIGDVNHTLLAENCAHALNHDEWLDDPDHEVWDLVLEAKSAKKADGFYGTIGHTVFHDKAEMAAAMSAFNMKRREVWDAMKAEGASDEECRAATDADLIMKMLSDGKQASERNEFKVTFKDGNAINTGFNGTLEEAQAYYVGKFFNFGDNDTKDKMVEAVSVEQLNKTTASAKVAAALLHEMYVDDYDCNARNVTRECQALCVPGNFIAACNGEHFLFFNVMPTEEDIEAATGDLVKDDWIVMDAAKPYMKDMFELEPSEEMVEKAYAEAVTTIKPTLSPKRFWNRRESSAKVAGAYSASWKVPMDKYPDVTALKAWWEQMRLKDTDEEDGDGELPPAIKGDSAEVSTETEAYSIASAKAVKWDYAYGVKCTEKQAWVVVAWVPE